MSIQQPTAPERPAPPVYSPPEGAPSPYPPPTVYAAPGNGMAVASLVLGIVATVLGLVPILALIALPCAILGVVFGVVGRRKAKRLPGRPRKTMAAWGISLGLIGIALSIIGIVIVSNAFDDLSSSVITLIALLH
jgi:hypothetical protein